MAQPAEDGRQADTIQSLLEAQVRLTPDRVAAKSSGRSITYGQLNARANRLAHLLRARGVGRDVLVGLLVDRSIETLVGMLAVLKAGGAYVPLDPDYPADRVSYVLDDAQAPLLLADRASASAIAERWNASASPSGAATPAPGLVGQVGGNASPRRPQIVVIGPDDDFHAESSENPEAINHPGDLSYVIYTSGSTGRPKGVQIAHKGVVNFLRSMRCLPGLADSDVVAAIATVSFDIAVFELLLPLTVGASTVIVTRDIATDGRRLAELIDDQGVTVMQATPATWRLLLDAGWKGSLTLKALSGGEAMSRQLADALLSRCASVWNGYGPTETTVYSTVHRVTEGRGPVPLGAPIANTTICILDESLHPVPPGEEGELCIGGDGVARGYLNRPDLTAERFVPDLFSGVAGSRLYRTGDLARQLPDGTLLFGGRRDHQVKIRGFRIELGEIENVLLGDPDVKEATVIAREDASGVKRLVAFVVWRDPRRGDTRAVRDRLRGTLPTYMIPSFVVALDVLPLTPNGKIDRKALAELSPMVQGQVAAPRDEIEGRLVRLWEELLEVSPIGVDADFFEVGGDSLRAAALFARIAREFGRDLPVSSLVHAPTIEALAALMRDGQEETAWTPLVPFRTKGTKRPFFFVHGGAGTVLFMRELVAGIDPERPVYGLQSEGQDGRPVVHESVEEMAAVYLKEMRRVQPSGPYLVGGYCFGGIVAFEIARQLREEGEEVSFVGLVNAPCPLARPDAIVEREVPSPVSRFRLRNALAWRWDVVRATVLRVRLAPIGARIFFAIGRRVPKSWRRSYILSVTERAERRYRPRPYNGRIAVIRGNGLYADPQLGWGGLASAIETGAIGGPQHLRRELIASPLVSELAQDLRDRLDRAETEAGA